MGIFKKFTKILKKAAPIIGGTIGFSLGGPLGGSLFAGLGTGIGSLVAGADPDELVLVQQSPMQPLGHKQLQILLLRVV